MGRLARRASTAEGWEDALALLRRAFELGARHFDTAQFYGDGLANRLLREAFQDARGEVVLATKVGAKPVSGAPVPLTAAQKPRELRDAVEANRASLGTDRLDVVYLRRMDYRPGLLAEGDQVVPLEDQLAELVALRDEGTITGIGLSHVTLDQLRTALPAGLACVQNIYHLLDRTFESLLSACRDDEVAWVPYFPLGGGGGYADLPKVTDDPVVRTVAEELDATPRRSGLPGSWPTRRTRCSSRAPAASTTSSRTPRQANSRSTPTRWPASTPGPNPNTDHRQFGGPREETTSARKLAHPLSHALWFSA
jgi:aryl-alcohol dehydrogenase-like predicted oxidoreductase